MDYIEICSVIPHRYPFLLVDRIVEMERGCRAVGIKNVSANEPHFAGHFPGNPVMPGVLMLEAMAQVGACALLSMEEYRGRTAYLAGADRLRFKRPVTPGDVLRISTELTRIKGNIGKARGQVHCDGAMVCSAELLFAIEPAGRFREDDV